MTECIKEFKVLSITSTHINYELFCHIREQQFQWPNGLIWNLLGVVFSHDKVYRLDPSKQPQALANL